MDGILTISFFTRKEAQDGKEREEENFEEGISESGWSDRGHDHVRKFSQEQGLFCS
jgi:hypothetical protein